MNPLIEVSTDLYITLRKLMQRGDRTISDIIWRLVEQQGINRTDPPIRSRSIRRNEGASSRGGLLPNGLRMRMCYKGNPYYYATIRKGKFWLNERVFDSPSEAASEVAKLSDPDSGYASINGWVYWEYEYPKGTDKWHLIDTLR